MHKRLKGGRGIFVFSDPAGAKACLAIASILIDIDVLVISDRTFPFFEDFKINVKSYDELTTSEWIDYFIPDFIFTGTSIPEKIELNFIKEAKYRNIKTISFVDHWTNIKQRFWSNQEYIYPSEIWLIDEEAKEKALFDGIPENLICISGNPYYDFLKNWRPLDSKKEVFNKIGIDISSRYILFAPEPLSSFDLQNKYGFDEVSGLKHLISSTENLNFQNIFIIIKGHPNQNHQLFIEYITESKNKKIIYLRDFDLNQLIFYSEVVVGYFSNSLIEAAIMDKKVIRILIDLIDIKLDPFYNKKVGVKICKRKSLVTALNKILY
jgi:hypothetical protein